METRGEEFIKNIKAKQEKEELEQRITELNKIDTSNKKIEEPTIEEEIVDLPAQELGDILLSEKQNPADKKKYIILGLSLVALFILTIVIIRVISSPSSEKEIVEEKVEQNIPQDKVEKDMTDIEKQYQDIINQKLKNLRENAENDEIESNQKAGIDINELEKKEQEIDKPEEEVTQVENTSKQDLFGMQKDQPKPTQTVVEKKAEPKVVSKPKPKPVVNNTAAPKGYFIQIGAFSKSPSKTLLDSINKYGFKYVLYDVDVKGTRYTKVLIGAYPSKGSASKDLSLVRSVLKVPGAYILYLK